MGASASKENNVNVVNTTSATESGAGRQDEDASTSSRCPVPENYRNPAIYNVYGQRINDPAQQTCPSPLSALQGNDLLDPKNNMPLEANQQPCPGQRRPLPVERVQSNIPKGGTDTTWLYPSPQMFYNGGSYQQHCSQPRHTSWHAPAVSPALLTAADQTLPAAAAVQLSTVAWIMTAML
eukprot:GHUV01019182.1.p1 GENE.GHUV01019182.1~~GHUV01019182.1.p1  ORF type:complete len:180 (+),score=31.59 GHUV01019182.1:385-924(+)